MALLIDKPIPINCVECDKRGIRWVANCHLIFSGCANCGRHPNCPLKEVSTGKWIDEGSYMERVEHLYKCAKCSAEFIALPPLEWDYCPDCGSKNISEEQQGE